MKNEEDTMNEEDEDRSSTEDVSSSTQDDSLDDDEMTVDLDDDDLDEDDLDGGDHDQVSMISEDDDYGNDDLPDFSQTEKATKKAFEVDHTARSGSDLASDQAKEVAHVAGILGFAPEKAATLLRFHKWNKEKMIEKYMDSPEQVLKDAGIRGDEGQSSAASSKRGLQPWKPGFTCEICYDDESKEPTFALHCQHRFCTDCWSSYLTSKIVDEGESRQIQCPSNQCELAVDEATVVALVGGETLTRYQELLNRTYVDDNDFLRWCPAPDCAYAIECHVGQKSLNRIVPTVNCACGMTFCFGCGLTDHQPNVCSLTKLWLKKCADDSETANWISANTKECTKCNATIEKSGGCNHMTCKKCRYEFCWVCMGPWSEHGTAWYNCNRFDEKSGADARDQQAKSRQSLMRYLHYYNRFANHAQSAKLDKELYTKTERKMEEMQHESDLSWIEVQFLKKAVDVLMICRNTLKWTYAFAYYLKPGNDKELFNDNQRDLELAAEQLSGLLEQPIFRASVNDLRSQVTNKAVYVSMRRDIILDDTARGLLENRWQFNVKV